MTHGLPLDRLYPVQRRVVEALAVVRTVIAGRGGGKSALLSWWAADGAARGLECLYVAPVKAQYEQAYRHLQALLVLPRLGRVAMREDVTRVVHVNGGAVELRTGKVPANLRGGGYGRVVLDEADYLPERSADVVFGGLARASVPCEVLIGTTPMDLPMASWVEGRYKRGLAGDAGHASFSWTAWDVPHTAKTGAGSLAWMRGGDLLDVESRAWTLDGGVARDVYEREVLALYVTVRGVRLQREWVDAARAAGAEHWPAARDGMGVGLGLDLAFTKRKSSDYSAAAVAGRDRAGCVWLLDAERIRGGLDPVGTMLRRLEAAWGPVRGLCEARGDEDPAVQALAREVRFPLAPIRPTADKVARFTATEAAFRLGRMRIAPTAPAWAIEEMLAFPSPNVHDDGVDAVAYAVDAAPDARKVAAYTDPMLLAEVDRRERARDADWWAS